MKGRVIGHALYLFHNKRHCLPVISHSFPILCSDDQRRPAEGKDNVQRRGSREPEQRLHAITELSIPCETTMCVVLKSKNRLQLLMKLSIGTVNLFSSILLFYLLKKARTKLSDRVVKMTISLEICLNIVPGYFAYLFNIAVGEPSYNYFGNYVGVLLNMDAAICGVYYSVILLYRSQNHLHPSSRIVQVSKTSG
ncbi:hypothetical protein Ddc_23015 [Ditylenchus destructor]|nr:hypothetical protein Ddc_23015 [Ditylenchus destructor]